ncbi:hypothetical protein KIW84_041613 [Lathyrus oleraceus]|uniref:Reverse transcriptase zinc-binding domain-containing protein n=1 Tax=Pisum sativum TaxID=3888 RepID=A0A9D5ALK4_PEA|nr:hypothetical protein KIW84_041613 [Pisum sativum]
MDLMEYGDSLEDDCFTVLISCKLGDERNMGWLGIWGWEGDAWRWDLGFTNLEESSVLGLEYVELMEMMSETCPIIGSPNIFLWPCGYLNSFSVKSYYDKLLQAADLVELESVLKTTLELIWNMKIPMKVKNFGWILLLDRLPTCLNLVVRGVISNIHDKTGLGEGYEFGRDTLDD